MKWFKSDAIKMAFAFVLLMIIPAWATDGDEIDETGCPAVFQKKCSCGMQKYQYWKPDEEVYLVNCTNTGFQDTDMLQLLPRQTQVLVFNGNNIPFLDWNIFGIVHDREEFEVIDLSNNKIQEISGKAFHKVSNVKRLVLNHNDLLISGQQHHHKRILTNFYNLEELHLTNAFTELIDSKWYLVDLKDILITSNMTALYKLHLEQNEIWNITEDMFCSLPNLSQLYLADNQLSDINFDLNCLKKLRHVDLQGNKIKRLDKSSLDKIDAYFAKGDIERKLDLYGNPFACDCQMRTFYDWLVDTKVLYEKDNLKCFSGVPEVNAGRQILNVLRLDCPEIPKADHVQTALGHSITHALLSILIILVAFLLIVLLVINRDRVKSNVKPLVVHFQKSMQYRTISKEPEVTEVNV